MNPTPEQLQTLFQTKEEERLYHQLGGVEHDLMMAEIRIEELESEIRKLKCQVLIEKAKNRDLDYARKRTIELEEQNKKLEDRLSQWMRVALQN